MKNAFDGLVSRLETVEERISELQNLSVTTTESRKQRKQRLEYQYKKTKKKKKTEYSRTVEQLQKMQHKHNETFRTGKRERKKINI